MPKIFLSRRAALFTFAATLGIGLRASISLAQNTSIRVVKDPNCGCCDAWIEILARDGFTASVELFDFDALQAHKVASGVPAEMISCHTAHVEGYIIEGHVPPADIRRLLTERLEAIGLSVPSMPSGSPGMGPESEREGYTVHLIRKDGSTKVYATYGAA
jgi:hypothetical protein